MWSIKNKTVIFNDKVIFENCNTNIQCDNSKNGAYLTFTSDTAQSENFYSLGRIKNFEKSVCFYRASPLFMSVHFGKELSSIKQETLCLLVRKSDGTYLILLPVFDENSRGAIQYKDDELQISGFTGNPDKKVKSGKLLYVIEGENPYDMMDKAADDLKEELKSFNLRKEKEIPSFLKYLGWCTWNAFYFDVDEEKYFAGLREFSENGVNLGCTIIDDGWLSTNEVEPIGARTLQSFEENRKKFPSGFKQVGKKAKEEFGITDFMVWHASMGYWAGNNIDKYDGGSTLINYPAALSQSADDLNKKFAHHPVNPQVAEEFYDDFHKYLKSVGVDGVKIDVQYLIEAVEGYIGSRFDSFNKYHSAKEKSISNNFNGNALNCMSCSNDMIYRMKNSNAIRIGADYNPDVNNSFLIVSNAYNSFWLYPITYTDWDMFFSNKEDSYVEAIARIASGSPVYISDELGSHNYQLLKQLGVEDGRVLRPSDVGRPTLDCLMNDPYEKGNILKLFNKNYCSYIIAMFNFSNESLNAYYSATDIEKIKGDEFIAFGFFDEHIRKINRNEINKLLLKGNSAELITFSPIVNGAAIIGLKDKINRSAAIENFESSGDSINITVISKGEYEIYCEKAPEKLFVNGTEKSYKYENNILIFYC